MNVELRTRVYGGHVVIALAGELDTTDAVPAAAAVMALAPGGQQLIIDLGALEFIDCCAVRALLGVRQSARQAGGDVLLAAPHGPVLRLLTLLDIPGVHSSVAAAAGSVPAAVPGLLPAGQRAAALSTGGVPLSGAPYRMMTGRLAVWCRRARITRPGMPRPVRTGGHTSKLPG